MVRPAHFGFNAETAASNAFQRPISDPPDTISQRAIVEFEACVQMLRSRGVNVLVFEDTPSPAKTDAVFPNNWISFHADGTVVLYPMLSFNRRLERRAEIIEELRNEFEITNIIDLAAYENEDRFLEGTGSVVFDHENKIAYAAMSPRTDKALFVSLCAKLVYEPVTFTARARAGVEIYHTNVLMCIGAGFAVVCLESISDEIERADVADRLTATRHEIVDITFEQMNSFAGNMLAIADNLLVMSQSAYDSLSAAQIHTLEKYCELLPLAIPTIETVGGGSARCMIAEIFLPKT